MHDKGILNIV